MEQQELIPHLFRTEFRKITAVLSRLFGIEYLDLAEDIASDTFLAAYETWTYKGIPENPVAWLYAVAKNKAKNQLRRRALFRDKIASHLSNLPLADEGFDLDMSDQNITDSQLQMMFAICDPAIPAEAQVCLALRVLCGFGIDEIAVAFLSNRETISKRLHRAKEKLRQENVAIRFPDAAGIGKRLTTVLTTLYLLFSEGYYSESGDSVLRKDLCLEAMRLAVMLTENKNTDVPAVSALLALMCFHASRFEARQDTSGEMILYHDQDESLWNTALIAQGAYYLKKASSGETVSKYHIEANIAYWHTHKADSAEKWDNILQLYNHLLQLEYSPVAALNRTFALAKVHGKGVALTEAKKLDLQGNHFYYLLLGVLHKDLNDFAAKENFQKAYALASTNTDRQSILKQLDGL